MAGGYPIGPGGNPAPPPPLPPHQYGGGSGVPISPVATGGALAHIVQTLLAGGAHPSPVVPPVLGSGAQNIPIVGGALGGGSLPAPVMGGALGGSPLPVMDGGGAQHIFSPGGAHGPVIDNIHQVLVQHHGALQALLAAIHSLANTPAGARNKPSHPLPLQ